MKKKNKLITGGLSLVFGALLLSGCTKSFCTVEDQAHILYMFDYGVTEYYDSKVEGSDALFEGNTNVYYKYTDVSKMPEESGIAKANSAAKSMGAPTPSVKYWAEVDSIVLDNALTKENLSKSTVSYEQLMDSLNKYGYLKFAGTEENNSLFAYYDKISAQAAASDGVAVDDCPTEDYLNSYKNALTSTIANYRSCFTIDEGDYGYYGYKSGTGFRPNPASTTMSKKTWGSAWKQGFFQGLLVYPIGWVTESFVNLYKGAGGLESGVPQILALLTVTVLVRGLMLLLTFKSTAASSKMQLIQPEIAKIQAKYPNSNTNRNDQQRMAMEMQALYKKHGINPFSSILVLFIQFPVFICVWGALQGSASLSTGSFLGLNLSASISSTLFGGAEAWSSGAAVTALILFILMAGAQTMSMLLPRILQRKKLKNIAKLGKNPAQKEQDSKTRIFTIVMLAMTIIMGFALVSAMGVYWLVGALFSIAQTLITNAFNERKSKNR